MEGRVRTSSRTLWCGGAILSFTALLVTVSPADELALSGYDVPPGVMEELRQEWTAEVLAEHPAGSWAPLKLELDDRRLALLGLPPRSVLESHRFTVPTMVAPDGTLTEVDLSAKAAASPAVASYAGVGCFGIRPGALILVFTDDTINFCSLAHVYGSSISTAGHCRENSKAQLTGNRATVIAALGNRNPVLLDFGTFGTTHDNGIGDDFALISVDSSAASLLSPTMCFWGGPRGLYGKNGALVSANLSRDCEIPSGASVTPDPFLAQPLVHFGHGVGVGAGGTPRMAFGQRWSQCGYFTFLGAFTPGDSGSGINAVVGDAAGRVNQAAGIMTHLYVAAGLDKGVGLMAGTRASKVGTPTNGQIVPYPVPAPGLP